MTTILLLKIALGLATTPSVLVVFRALAKRIGRIPKEKATEAERLWVELKATRDEARTALRDAVAAEHAERMADIADRDQEAVRLRHIIDRQANEIDALAARVKVAEHEVATSRLFVDGATTTRRDKR